jgi:hypothetical protein
MIYIYLNLNTSDEVFFYWSDLMPLSNIMFKLTNKLKLRLNIIKELCKEDLKNAVYTNVYMFRTPIEYERTFSLLNSISVSEVETVGNTLSFRLYFDKSKLNHFSVVSGTHSYVPPLLDEGNTQDGYGDVDYFHNYPGRDFLTTSLERIKNDLNHTLKEVVKYEIKKLGGKSKY